MSKHDAQAEQALLGAVILNPNHGIDMCLQRGITRRSFHDPMHASIFAATLDLWKETGTVEPLTIERRTGITDRLFVENLLDTCGTAAHAGHYAAIVSECERRRDMERIGKKIVAAAESEEFESAVAEAEGHFLELMTPGVRQQTLPETADEMCSEWDRLASGELSQAGVPSRFGFLQQYIGGYSEYTILAGRPTQGKSTLMLNEAASMVIAGYSVAIISVEMTAKQCLGRMACEQADANYFAIKNGHGPIERLERARDKARYLAGLKLHIIDDLSTIENICSWARMAHARHGLDILFIDYMQIIQPTKRYSTMNERVQDYSANLLQLRKQLGIPVVALSQLSRAVESEHRLPRLSDLRDSGAIEQDGHTVLLLSEDPESGDHDAAILQVAKNRDGPTGKTRLEKNFRRQRFEVSVVQGVI